ncbi:hypothetical protein KC315_g10574, partial [Hortaea werneckii]
CVGFTYYGTSTGPTTGGGRCFHFYNGQQGNLNYNTTYLYPDAGTYSLFGSAYLLQASENLLCPTYNGTYFLDAQGQAYYILCGYGSTSQYQNTAARDGPACLALCDAQAQCIGVTVVYGGAESNANNNANCYLASAGLNTIANTRNVLAVRTTMPSFVPTTTTTTTTSTRSSAITPVSPTAPPPSFACPADDIQQLQENGQNYYVGCGMVAQGTTSAAYIATNSWNDCFGYCDATIGCTGFTYEGAVDGNGAGTCFLRNSAPIGLVPSDAYHVGAVKAAYYGWQVTTTRPFTTTTTSTTTSTTTTTTSSSSSAAAQTVTYTYVSSYPVTYTTSYVTTAVSTAPGSTVISTYETTAVSTYVTTAPASTITSTLPASTNTLTTTQRTTATSTLPASTNTLTTTERTTATLTERTTVPVTQTYTTVSSYPVTTVIVSTASGSTITQTTSYYATSTEISTTVVYSTGQAPTVTSTIAAQTVTQTTASSYGVTCSTVISTYVSYATSTFVSYATLTTTQPTTVVSTQVSSYGVTTTAPGTYADDAPTWRTADYRVELKPINDRGWVMLTRNTSFDRKNHCANHNCINSASIDHYPDSANDRCLYFPLDNPGHRDLYNAVFLSLHIYPCQHSFWLYYHGNFGSLSDDHPNITPSVDCREHRLFNDCIYPNSVRTNSGFDGYLYHKLRLDLSDIISGDNNIGQHRARLYRHD